MNTKTARGLMLYGVFLAVMGLLPYLLRGGTPVKAIEGGRDNEP